MDEPDDRALLVDGYRHKPMEIRARILHAECADADTAPEMVPREPVGHIYLGCPWSVLINDRRVLVTYYFNRSADGPRTIGGTILEANWPGCPHVVP
ncbi:MAG TPA: hypothetical protein VGE76_19120 [Opitutaceae bacterium]